MISIQCVGRRRLDIEEKEDHYEVRIMLSGRPGSDTRLATLIIPRLEFEKIYGLKGT